MTTYQIIETTEETEVAYHPYGAAGDLWMCKNPEIIISGPAECLAGETVIDGTELTIAELEEKQIAPLVHTLYGQAKAEPPFVKGVSALYKIKLENGLEFTATKNHLVFTSLGWLPVGVLQPGLSLLASCQSFRQKNSAFSLLEFLLNARHLSDIRQDYQSNYLSCSYPCDVQLRQDQDSVRDKFPLLDGALLHNHDVYKKDGQGFLLEHNHFYLSFVPHSIWGCSPLIDRNCIQYYNAQNILLLCGDLSLRSELSQNMIYLRLPDCEPIQDFCNILSPYDRPMKYCSFLNDFSLVEQNTRPGLLSHLQSGNSHKFPIFYVSDHHLDVCNLLSFHNPPRYNRLAKCNSTVQWTTVSNVEFQRVDKYYDLHVPGIGHYFADGILHHNTGKTLAALHKIDALAWKYPKAHLALIRKTRQSMDASVLKTYQDKVKHPDIFTYGGYKPHWFDYPNGSRLVIGGMDNPNKVLSAEYDVIYVNQAEELILDDWEKLLTRATGRAGHMPYAQVLGDCNPGPNSHWILQRRQESSLTFLESRHEDNPTLFDPQSGQITKQGRRTMAVLDSLTGVRYQRLRLGKWVSAEGQIYEGYDAAIHLIDRFNIPDSWRRIRVIDFGLVHPLVCQWWAIDEDERMYRYREIYMTGRTVKTHADQIKELSKNERIEETICDHDAEDRLTLAENGIPNIAAKKDVLQGIGKVQDRLSKQEDGRPRLFFLRDSLIETDQELLANHLPTCTEDEIDSYIWKSSSRKEEPVKENDHGVDATRYAVMYLDGASQWRSIEFLSVGNISE